MLHQTHLSHMHQSMGPLFQGTPDDDMNDTPPGEPGVAPNELPAREKKTGEMPAQKLSPKIRVHEVQAPFRANSVHSRRRFVRLTLKDQS